MNHCTELQEQIARGAPLASEGQQHVLACEACAAVAVSYSQLDAAMRDLRGDVPDGFAERVLARVSRNGELGARPLWLLLALAPICALMAAGNVIWFVLASLLPAAGIGSAP